MDLGFIQNIVLSIVLGLLIGLQREMHIIYSQKERDFGGTRTFAIISLLGFLSGWINKIYPHAFVVFVVVFSLMLIAAYIINSISTSHKGTTTEFAAMIVFLIGAMLNFSTQLLAVLLTIIVMFLLNLKEKIQDYEKSITKEDFGAAVFFLLMTFVILPIIPDEPIDPFGLINLFKIWTMVVVVAGISFFGYIAIKLLKTKNGIAIAGFFGGLISSTAVAMSMSRKIHENGFLVKNLAIAITLASSMMLIRTDLILWAFNPVLAKSITIPFVIGLITGFAYILFIYFRTKYENIPSDIKFKNPYDLKEALLMGLVFGFVLAIVELTDKYSGSYGVYAVSFISGIADVDAITLSLATIAEKTNNISIAYNAIIIALVSNTIAKSTLVVILGNKAIFKEVFIYYLISVGSFTISGILLN
ncbi:MAG: MgtC/SapB family protein [Epsilonproteobacteria bacterium]|nr:MgtC/SapB family protein [Campylobacterota bacterium]